MRIAKFFVIIFLLLWMAPPSFAGPFSPGKGGVDEAGFMDAGIAGFVDGVVNPVFQGWATKVIEYSPSDETTFYGQNSIGPEYADPSKALGAVTGSNTDIVSLGDMHPDELTAYFDGIGYGPATLTLGFDHAIVNGEGADFATFENGFISTYNTGDGSVSGMMFAELGYVEVSTNGIDFARFPNQYFNYLDGGPSSQSYLTQDVSNIYNLAGKHANAYGESFGTPFDLDDLSFHYYVLTGLVDLNEINYVRIVDIPGDGSFYDSYGNSIYDAWVTFGSGGMDFEALGVINQAPFSPSVPVPSAFLLLACGLVGLAGAARRIN